MTTLAWLTGSDEALHRERLRDLAEKTDNFSKHVLSTEKRLDMISENRTLEHPNKAGKFDYSKYLTQFYHLHSEMHVAILEAQQMVPILRECFDNTKYLTVRRRRFLMAITDKYQNALIVLGNMIKAWKTNESAHIERACRMINRLVEAVNDEPVDL